MQQNTINQTQVDACLAKLRDALKLEVRLHETLAALSGTLEPILAAALAGSSSSPSGAAA